MCVGRFDDWGDEECDWMIVVGGGEFVDWGVDGEWGVCDDWFGGREGDGDGFDVDERDVYWWGGVVVGCVDVVGGGGGGDFWGWVFCVVWVGGDGGWGERRRRRGLIVARRVSIAKRRVEGDVMLCFY